MNCDPHDQEHRATCSDCAMLWQAYEQLRAPQAPARLQRNVLAALDRRSTRRRPTLLVWGAAAACYLLLLLCLGWLASRPKAPEILSPRLVRFWATAPNSPQPLQGGL